MRFGVSIILMAAATQGCSGEFTTIGEPVEDPAAQARAKFEAEVLPMLNQACAACHSGSDAVGFMRPSPDVWSSVISHPNLVVGGNANDSRLYAYGRSSNHSGTELTPDQAELVRQWIDIVPETNTPPPAQVETNQFEPVTGANSVDISELGEGVEGANITFTATMLGQGLYITNLAANAGANGLHLAHPLFVTYCPSPKPDPVDSFYGLDQIVNPAEAGLIGGGTVILVDFAPGCKIAVLFKVVEPGMTGPGGGDPGGLPGGGCVNPGGFTMLARGPLSNQCASCHAGGQSAATNSFDLTAVNDMSTDGQARACAQSRGKINLNNEQLSILFQRVQPGQQTGHPLTLPDAQYTAFRDAVVGWATTE